MVTWAVSLSYPSLSFPLLVSQLLHHLSKPFLFFFFFFNLVVPHGMWDLSSLSRD